MPLHIGVEKQKQKSVQIMFSGNEIKYVLVRLIIFNVNALSNYLILNKFSKCYISSVLDGIEDQLAPEDEAI